MIDKKYLGLEKKLAEIEVLTENISGIQFKYRKSDWESSEQSDSFDYRRGIANESRLLIETVNRIFMSPLGSEERAIRVGEFALAIKNLADNLNKYIQLVYGNSKVSLSNLEKNTRGAPLTKDGRNLYDLFVSVHDNDKSNPLIIARNGRAHGTQTNFVKGLSSYNVPKIAVKYLDMTITCLRTIIENDSTDYFRKYEYPKLPSKIRKRRITNFVNRHKRPFVATTATALLTLGIIGGSVGTLAWKNYQDKKELEKQLSKAKYVIGVETGSMPVMDNWEIVSHLSEKYAEEILRNEIISRSKLGIGGINRNNWLVQEILTKE